MLLSSPGGHGQSYQHPRQNQTDYQLCSAFHLLSPPDNLTLPLALTFDYRDA